MRAIPSNPPRNGTADQLRDRWPICRLCVSPQAQLTCDYSQESIVCCQNVTLLWHPDSSAKTKERRDSETQQQGVGLFCLFVCLSAFSSVVPLVPTDFSFFRVVETPAPRDPEMEPRGIQGRPAESTFLSSARPRPLLS